MKLIRFDWVCWLVALLGFMPAARADVVEMELTLVEALFQTDPAGPGRSVLVELRQEAGHWDRVIAVAGDFNPNHHFGRVRQGTLDDASVKVDLELLLRGDPYVPGGRGRFSVDLTRVGDDLLEGSYRGTFRGVERTGTAKARIKPKVAPPPGVEPVSPGEHPRLLFRKSDLPKLRERINTPFGQAMLARFEGAAGEAMKYQLTGDRAHAEAARKLVEKHMAERDNGDKFVRSRVWGWRMEQMALAYDLCYDAWDPAFREEVARHFVAVGNRLAFSRGLLHREISWTLTENYPGTILYGTAIAGAAVWGEKGPKPARPVDPDEGRDPLAVIEPDNRDVPEGVPVSKLVLGQMPDDWLFAGGLKATDADDLLQGLGGYPNARPKVGDVARIGEEERAFAPISKEKDKGYWNDRNHTRGQTVIDITNAIGRAYHSTSCFYTIVENDMDRYARLQMDHGGAHAYLAGQRVANGAVVRLRPGRYPLLIVVTIGETNPWGRILMRPRFEELTEADARAAVEAHRAGHSAAIADWEYDVAEWERTGGQDQDLARLFQLSRQLLRRGWRDGIAAGGVQNTGGFPMGLDGAVRYASVHRNAFGVPANAIDDIALYLPFKLFSVQHTTNGPVATDINGQPLMMIDNVYHETRDLSLEFFAALYPAVPDQYKPAVRRMWDRYAGLDAAAGDYERLLRNGPRRYNYRGYDALPIYVFVNYPIDVPADQQVSLPNVWASEQAGYLGIRSGWDGDRDFLTQVVGRGIAHAGNTRENAGTIRVQGLGHVWSHGEGKAHGERFGENVVQLPGDLVNLGGRGRVTHLQTTDTTAIMSLDLSEVYTAPATDDEEKRPALFERYGNLAIASSFKPSGISGMRSVAIDYSGKSGSPCLIVIVDRVDGATRSQWTWQIDSRRENAGRATPVAGQEPLVEWGGKRWPYRAGTFIKDETAAIDDPNTTVTPHGFVLRRGDAQLNATVVAPSSPEISFVERRRYTQAAKHGVSCALSRAVFVEGEGTYFVVMTVQEGDAPKPQIEGRGLDAVVRIGDRVVRFDGKNVVLE